MPGADSQTIFVRRPVQGPQQTPQVRQRFSHPHHDDVAESFLRCKQGFELQDLLQDLSRREVSNDAIESAGAKDASHPASDLRADADRAITLVVAEQNTLDEFAILCSQQQLFRAIRTFAMAGNLHAEDFECLFEVPPNRLRNIRHFVKRDLGRFVNPMQDLSNSIAWLTFTDKPISELPPGIIEQMFHD